MKPAVLDDDSNEDDDAGDRKKGSKKKKLRKLKQGDSGFETSDDEVEDDEETDDNLPELMQTKSEEREENNPEATDADRRKNLYDCWSRHFRKLSKKKRSLYKAPKPFDLPTKVNKPSFMKQLGYQITRLVLLGYRNWYSKLLDTTIIVGAVILVSALDGVVEPTKNADMNDLDYYAIAEPSGTVREAGEAMLREFPKLFQYALRGNGSVVA